MGYMTALGIKDSGIDIREQLRWHLTGNCYPPIPTAMIDPGIEAIRACNEGEYDRIITTPFEHRQYGYSVPAWVVVEDLHLDAWVEGEEV